MTKTLSIEDERVIYDANDILITGIYHENKLWLFNKEVRRWSPSAYKEWLWAIEEIRFTASEQGIDTLLCYVKTDKAYRFANMLGFEELETRGDFIIMSQDVDVYRS